MRNANRRRPDAQIYFKNQKAAPGTAHPAHLPLPDVLSIVIDSFTSATERHIEVRLRFLLGSFRVLFVFFSVISGFFFRCCLPHSLDFFTSAPRIFVFGSALFALCSGCSSPGVVIPSEAPKFQPSVSPFLPPLRPQL